METMTSPPMTTTLSRAVLHEAEQRRDIAHESHVLALKSAMDEPTKANRDRLQATSETLAKALGSLELIRIQVDEILRRDGNAS